MKRQCLSKTQILTVLCLALILPSILNLPPVLGVPNEPYTSCGTPFNCGKIAGIGYPFWGGGRPEECGHPALKLHCENGTTTIQINNVKYRVLDLNQGTQILKVARDDLSRSLCPQEFRNTTLDPALFEYASGYVNLTLLYGCRALDFPVPYQFDCPVKGVSERNGYVQFAAELSGVCHASVVFPVSYTSFLDLKGLAEAVGQGFDVRFKVGSDGACSECESSGGRCGYDVAGKEFVAFVRWVGDGEQDLRLRRGGWCWKLQPTGVGGGAIASSGTQPCLFVIHFHERNLE
ncbi:LEAF RUST 10 DISEASE-RESISTANCE LOCUS RECEPTOR-LIKE PROTEIN KINASE-like 2.4 [Sesamum angolense]|uniref:non-specific serine/threonine protein kinase n=1 Tax=Sesamum angolense TaxID=2727404 RepID=A0AAE1WI27_9LAMI|nr:LEAF RUST 10 DISEASE-RESISTANCE LOCUS RECEPTOR-LIKE PROTEIN KINASE-like 2.4 [Sesamum angolense]